MKKTFIDEIKAMKDRMEEIFQRNYDILSGVGSEQSQASEWLPAADIVDTGKVLIYVLDLPGVFEEDLLVECKAGSLWVSGTRKSNLPEGEVIRTETVRGAFSRIFKLPCVIRENEIQAELKKGVLRITVPKECATGGGAQRIFVRKED